MYRLILTLTLIAGLASSLTAQTLQTAAPTVAQVPRTTTPTAEPPATPPGPPSTSPQSNRLPSLPLLASTTNIQVELTLTDTLNDSQATKTVSMVMLSGTNGMVRASSSGSESLLNVDAIAYAYQNGMIGVGITFDFTASPITAEAKTAVRALRINESLRVVLIDGKPLVVSQATDAASGRIITATIKATVRK